MVAFATDERMQPPPIHPFKICPSEDIMAFAPGLAEVAPAVLITVA